MSAFIDCFVCRSRIIYKTESGMIADDRGMTEAALVRYFRSQGCTVKPTRCPDHAKAKGAKVVEAARASFETCTLDHDDNPWVRYAGIATGGMPFNGGGAQSGRWSLSIRPEFCQTESHYWTFPEMAVAS